MWKIHMLGSDNHTNMQNKYTDRLINRSIRSNHQIKRKSCWWKQYRREIFRGMWGFMFCMYVQFWVQQSVCQSNTKTRETLDKGEEMKKKCIYIWMYSSYYLHDSVTWDNAAQVVRSVVSLSSQTVFHSLSFHSLNWTRTSWEAQEDQTAVRLSHHETSLTCRDPKTKLCSSPSHSIISSFFGHWLEQKREVGLMANPNCLTSVFFRYVLRLLHLSTQYFKDIIPNDITHSTHINPIPLPFGWLISAKEL